MNLTDAEYEILRTKLSAHPEVSEQSTQDQPNPLPILKEARLALRLALGFDEKVVWRDALERTLANIEQFLADPQQVERDAAGERGENIVELNEILEWLPEATPARLRELVQSLLAKAEGRSNA